MKHTDVLARNLAALAISAATTASDLALERRYEEAKTILLSITGALEHYSPFCCPDSMAELARLSKRQCEARGLDNDLVAPELIANVIRVGESVDSCLAFATAMTGDEKILARSFKYLWEHLSIELGIIERAFPEKKVVPEDLKVLFGKKRFAFYRQIHHRLALSGHEHFQERSNALQARARLLKQLVCFLNTCPSVDPLSMLWDISLVDVLRVSLGRSLQSIGLDFTYLDGMFAPEPGKVLEYSPDVHAELFRIFALAPSLRG